MKIQIILIFVLMLISYANVKCQKVYIEKKSSSIIVTYPDSTVLINISYIKKVKKTDMNALYYWYKGNKIHSNQGSYSGYLLDGKFQSFNKSGNLISEGYFTKGVKTKSWHRWAGNGMLLSTENYKNGLKNGFQYEYNCNQDVKVYKYKNGILKDRKKSKSKVRSQKKFLKSFTSLFSNKSDSLKTNED